MFKVKQASCYYRNSFNIKRYLHWQTSTFCSCLNNVFTRSLGNVICISAFLSRFTFAFEYRFFWKLLDLPDVEKKSSFPFLREVTAGDRRRAIWPFCSAVFQFLDTVKNSSGFTNISLQIHLLHIQLIYHIINFPWIPCFYIYIFYNFKIEQRFIFLSKREQLASLTLQGFSLTKAGPSTNVLSWQQHNRCQFISWWTFSGAKFEEHFNISRDILYSRSILPF